MFDRLQALEKFVDSNSNQYSKLVKEIIPCVFETTFNTGLSAGTQEADQFTTLLDFIIDIGGTGTLKRFVQHCFKEYYELQEELD